MYLNSSENKDLIVPVEQSKHKVIDYTEETFYRKRPYVVNKFIYDVLITPRKACSVDGDIVILVHSEHSEVKVRQAIRETWGSLALNAAHTSTWPQDGNLKLSFVLFFIFGAKKDEGLNDLIQEENETYGDMIQGNFIDSYTNMTLKSLLGLKFVSEFCSSAKYLLKSDSDMFINLPYLTQFLNDNPFNKSILGPICVNSKVYRNGKWAIGKRDFPFETYPTYDAGSAYIISKDLWKDMFHISDYVPHIYIDDVYITGILGRILNVTHIVQPGFAYWTSRNYKVCDIQQNIVFTITNLKYKDIRKIWETLKIQKCLISTTHS